MIKFDAAHEAVHHPPDRRFRIWIKPSFVVAAICLGLIPLALAWGQATIFGLPHLAPLPKFNPATFTGVHGFPWWLRWAHFFNFVFLMMLVRSGLSILVDHPRLYFNNDCTPGSEWIRFTPLHVPTDRMWTAKDDARYISPIFGLPGYRHTVGVARSWHFIDVYGFIITGLIFIPLLFVSGQWARLVPDFVQQLALLLTSWEATTFLIGEYSESELRDNPVFTVADGLFWLFQQVERNSVVRKMQVMKLRGQASVPGLHTFRITEAGLQAFSRTLGLTGQRKTFNSVKRLSTGIPALDEMMGGGVPEGDSLLIAGSSGTGKSLMATQFLAAGIRAGEAGIAAVFEERPNEYTARASEFGLDLQTPLAAGTLEVIYLRPLDLSVDEMMQEILDAVKRTGAKRLVIDSLAGFEMALAPSFRADFRESLYRMIFALTGIGITILSTLEMPETFTELLFSSYSISFLTDDIIRMRYVEIDGQLSQIMMVVKMRRGAHSREIRQYQITTDGIVIGERLKNYVDLITGIPQPLPVLRSEELLLNRKL